MQDRFRFRVFDKQLNKYIDFTGRISDYADYPEQFKVEQCSGLKDKEGNLIWEGDICTTTTHNVLIEWFKGGLWVNGFQNGAKWNIHTRHDGLKIIGNINENKELLEGEEK